MPYSEDRKLFNGRKIFIKDGYECIDDGSFKYVHRLILEEHLGIKLEPNEDTHHKDENKRNNEPSNLEVRGHQDHARHHVSDKFQYDTTGSKNGMSKLNEEKVKEILTKVHNKSDIQNVANEYNVHYVTIWDIWKGRSWKHVER